MKVKDLYNGPFVSSLDIRIEDAAGNGLFYGEIGEMTQLDKDVMGRDIMMIDLLNRHERLLIVVE